MKRTPRSKTDGFGTVQLIITIALTVIIGAFAVVGITRAREHVRLMNSARQFAAYVERARGDAVRRHGSANVQVLNTTTYAVTMDWDGLGSTRTQNFNLERGVVFTTGEKGVTFNWRGRIAWEESFGFSNGRNTVSVGVTGSGDVTFDAQFFHDASLPPVALNGPGSTPTPDASPSPGYLPPDPTPTPVPSPTPPLDEQPTPIPTPIPDTEPEPTPTVNPSPTPDASPEPSTSPTPDSGASGPCTIVVSPDALNIIRNGATTVTVSRDNATGIGTITATSSNSAQIQVTPPSRSVNGSSVVTFTVTVKNQAGSVTFSSSGCGTKVVPVNVQ